MAAPPSGADGSRPSCGGSVKRTGLTGEEVASRLGWSGSKVSRIELHRIGVKRNDLRDLLDLYGVGDPHREELLALADESKQKNWLEVITATFPPEHAAYYHAEAEARSIWNWEPQVVPGLLQTPEYARAVIQLWPTMFPGPQSEVDRRVEARVIRQQLLTRDPPLELTAVIDESVLHRRFGSKAVMTAQLTHLVEASELPNVELRILPLDGEESPAGNGARSRTCNLLRSTTFRSATSCPLNNLRAAITSKRKNRHSGYRAAFEYLARKSLDPEHPGPLVGRPRTRCALASLYDKPSSAPAL